MATKISGKVKVINSPNGLGGYSNSCLTSSKLETFKNGTVLQIDRVDTDPSGIWYRSAEHKVWLLYRSASGQSYLKVITDTPTTPTSSSSNGNSSQSDVTGSGIPSSTLTTKESTSGSVSQQTADTVGSSGTEEKKNRTNTVALVKGITTDIIQQNESNYPPVDHVDEKTGDIWYKWTINMNSFADDVLKIKRNLNIPSAYDRLEIAKLTHTKFNRYRIEYGDYNLKPTIGYVVFTRPDLNLFDNKKQLLAQISNDPQLYYIWRNNPSVMKQLSLDFAQDNYFIPLLTNRVTSLDVADESVDTLETGETWTGYKLQYAKHSIRSLTAGTVSVKFPETEDLSITQMFQTWCTYESGVYRGTMIPKQDYCMYKILDYACNIYYFLMDTDWNIKFWTTYYGAFPTNVNKSIFTYDMGSNAGGSDVNITFAYFHKLDMDMRSLVHFNTLSGGVNDGISYKADTDPSMCLGGGGNTWSGAPFVEVIKKPNGTDIVDTLKLRFRT